MEHLACLSIESHVLEVVSLRLALLVRKLAVSCFPLDGASNVIGGLHGSSDERSWKILVGSPDVCAWDEVLDYD